MFGLINFKNLKFYSIKNLREANKNDITFLHSSKYKDVSIKTKASASFF